MYQQGAGRHPRAGISIPAARCRCRLWSAANQKAAEERAPGKDLAIPSLDGSLLKFSSDTFHFFKARQSENTTIQSSGVCRLWPLLVLITYSPHTNITKRAAAVLCGV